MIPRIYIDTSVIGGCFDKEYEKPSKQLWNEFLAGKNLLSFRICYNLNWRKPQQESADC